MPLPDADIRLLREFDAGLAHDELLSRLIAETAWTERPIVLWGKPMMQPRLVAWYGDDGCSYTYSRTRYDPLPWTSLLAGLRGRVERACGEKFDAVLVNYYRNERDSVSMHSDDEPELGPVIASLSVGETRTFVLRHRRDRSIGTQRIPLDSGTLLLMKRETQRFWQHAVPKETRPCGPRVNLTFRQLR